MVRPMQRLTKYSLLLTAVRKHISEENEIEIMDAMVRSFLIHYDFLNMNFILQVHSVDEFVFGVNSYLTTRQETERLKGILARIEGYEAVVSNFNCFNFYVDNLFDALNRTQAMNTWKSY